MGGDDDEGISLPHGGSDSPPVHPNSPEQRKIAPPSSVPDPSKASPESRADEGHRRMSHQSDCSNSSEKGEFPKSKRPPQLNVPRRTSTDSTGKEGLAERRTSMSLNDRRRSSQSSSGEAGEKTSSTEEVKAPAVQEPAVQATPPAASPAKKPQHPWSTKWRAQHMATMSQLHDMKKQEKHDSDSEEEKSSTMRRANSEDNMDSPTRIKKPPAGKPAKKTLRPSGSWSGGMFEAYNLKQNGSFSNNINSNNSFNSSFSRLLQNQQDAKQQSPPPPLAPLEDSGLKASAFGSFILRQAYSNSNHPHAPLFATGSSGGPELKKPGDKFLQRFSFSGPEQLDSLLDACGITCDETEKSVLVGAFMCPVCDSIGTACTTTSDQIRAVLDGFDLIHTDPDEDSTITLSDLRSIASWTSDEEGMEFANHLISMLRQRYRHLDFEQEVEFPISRKEFLLAFARCLVPDDDDDVEQILEKRAVEYRKVGKLFGMERVQQQFSWTKFWFTLLSDAMAPVTFPLCKLQAIYMEVVHGDEDNRTSLTLHEILTKSQWLPVPYTTFDDFQYYLMKLWLPSFVAFAMYIAAIASGNCDLTWISLPEVSSPIVIYIVIGTYISFISGYEHPRMVLRRLNPCLSADLKMNELRAIFAFRAHTPEGHMVDQIGSIADFLFAPRFLWSANLTAALCGMLHGLMPTLHRVFYHQMALSPEATAKCLQSFPAVLLGTNPAVQSLWVKFVSQPYFWVCGGTDWMHPLISLPSTFISGYLTYRLLYITSVGFNNDMAFYNRLRLFRAMTQPEPFLRFRARWLRQSKKRAWQGRPQFLQFLNLQKRDDLVLWCRIRQLLVESYAAGFRNKQGDIIVTMMLLSVLALTSYIFFFQIRAENRTMLSVLDLRARVDVFVFSLLLISIVNLKLSIHGLRKSDISLLHKEHYAAAMAEVSKESQIIRAESNGSHKHRPVSGSRFAASFVARRRSACSPEGSFSPLSVRPTGPLYRAGSGGRDSPTMDKDESADMPYKPKSMYPTSSYNYPTSSYRRGSIPETDPFHHEEESPKLHMQMHTLLPPPARTSSPPPIVNSASAKGSGKRERRTSFAMAGGPDGAGVVVYAGDPSPHDDGDRSVVNGVQGGSGRTEEEDVSFSVQQLLDHTARYIAEFDKPPRLLSFTVSIHFLRYIFLPLLSPIIAAFRAYAYGHSKRA